MSKFPTSRLVLATVLSLIFVIGVFPTRGADTSVQLQLADSLFAANKYTESLEVYESVLATGAYSPSMLLKMAYINEGLGDVSGALYFLNLYYQQTSNKKVLAKLGELARDNQLAGYDFGDYDFFLNLYHRYQLQVIGFLLVLSLGLLAMMTVQRRKTSQRPYVLGVSYIVSLGLLFYLINFGLGTAKGIIVDQQTYLMTGPSGGSDVVGIIEKGHRVEILDTQGVWVKIRWEDQEVYVRQSKIRTIS